MAAIKLLCDTGPCGVLQSALAKPSIKLFRFALPFRAVVKGGGDKVAGAVALPVLTDRDRSLLI